MKLAAGFRCYKCNWNHFLWKLRYYMTISNCLHRKWNHILKQSEKHLTISLLRRDYRCLISPASQMIQEKRWLCITSNVAFTVSFERSVVVTCIPSYSLVPLYPSILRLTIVSSRLYTPNNAVYRLNNGRFMWPENEQWLHQKNHTHFLKYAI